MKLIDLLVQELPKRGGWPDGAVEAGFLCSKTTLYFVDANGDCPSEWRIEMDSEVEDNDIEISKDQYESALAALQKPAWNGGGLPPVGCECEISFSGKSLGQCEVLFVGDSLIVWKQKSSQQEGSGYHRHMNIRPLRTEAERKRNAAAKEMARHANSDEHRKFNAGLRNCLSIYDAIAAGKIPGVRLDD
jgi:hypothetical protein